MDDASESRTLFRNGKMKTEDFSFDIRFFCPLSLTAVYMYVRLYWKFQVVGTSPSLSGWILSYVCCIFSLCFVYRENVTPATTGIAETIFADEINEHKKRNLNESRGI